jgi:hypothetical protein
VQLFREYSRGVFAPAFEILLRTHESDLTSQTRVGRLFHAETGRVIRRVSVIYKLLARVISVPFNAPVVKDEEQSW